MQSSSATIYINKTFFMYSKYKLIGLLAKSKISKAPGLKGDGMALASIIMGFVAIGLIVVSVIFGAASIIMDNVK